MGQKKCHENYYMSLLLTFYNYMYMLISIFQVHRGHVRSDLSLVTLKCNINLKIWMYDFNLLFIIESTYLTMHVYN
jgi:hypothetical protein